MGWTSRTNYERRRLNANELKSAIKSMEFSGNVIVAISLQNHNREAYVVWEHHTTNKRHLAVVVIQNNIEATSTKCMSIDTHPYYYRCPISYLKLINETDNEEALKWIEYCKEYNKWASVYRKGLLNAEGLKKIHDNIEIARMHSQQKEKEQAEG